MIGIEFSRHFYSRRTFSFCYISLIIIGFLCGTSFSYTSESNHEGSAPTNEFTLSETHPNARILINSSNTIILINVFPPSSSRPSSYKVSLELLAMQLCDVKAGDRLKIVYTDPTSIRNEIWKINTSFSETSERKEVNDIQASQIVLIPEGRWVLSGADIVATLYEDGDSCNDNQFKCSCTSRCISQDLVCNGNPNCGLGCMDDEDEPKCAASKTTFSTDLNCSTPFLPPRFSTTENTGNSGSSLSYNKIITRTAVGSLTINMLFMILISYVIFK